MTPDNFCFYLQNRLIQTSQSGGQQYSGTSPFSIPWFVTGQVFHARLLFQKGIGAYPCGAPYGASV